MRLLLPLPRRILKGRVERVERGVEVGVESGVEIGVEGRGMRIGEDW